MRKKVMFISSAGGHLEQLLALKETMESYDYILVTELNPSTEKLKKNFNNVFFLPFFSRQKKWTYPLTFFFICIKSFQILRKTSPDIIVTTGAGGVVPMCVFGKLMRSKIIFIETFSRINTTTISGKICYHLADVFIIQWGSLKKHYPKGKYFGHIY